MSSPADASEQRATAPARFAHYPSLAGRAVLITGGATGMGASFVEQFAAQHAKVGFIDMDAGAGAALADRLGDSRHRPVFATCDLTDLDALRKAVADLRDALGPFTALVNNAANDRRHVLREVTPAYYDASIAVNLRHQFFATQAVVPDMKVAGAGAIVNLGSISWMTKTANLSIYQSAKAAVHGMTRGLARELGPHGIRVNTLSPGWVMTNKQRRLWLDDDGRRAIKQGQCLDRELLPEDIARMALFLCADDSAMITAQQFIVDGGWA
ncbi:SDR family oxidoreductase [Mycetohabitans sp. B8]|uniref:SDR family NAD(P)-dependent oxidoreductase n=1 Tax=Mycetohabitans sp. B8 TaxID=2841845 RepID=UPI001F3F0C3F|nr:SDR family oxidoreductase [Mycetohabitans sp. B8]MCG1041398.1 SDR family oxidoreductase [Mycetohabitans sp. B8]